MADATSFLSRITKVNTGLLKNLPFVGLLGAAAVVAPFIASGLRNDRRYNEDNVPPMPKDLADPLPPILQYTPPEQAQPLTMMGEPPVAGQFAQKEINRRGGINAGPDVIPPNILTPGGVSAIDGKHVQDLSKESQAPHFGLPA